MSWRRHPQFPAAPTLTPRPVRRFPDRSARRPTSATILRFRIHCQVRPRRRRLKSETAEAEVQAVVWEPGTKGWTAAEAELPAGRVVVAVAG